MGLLLQGGQASIGGFIHPMCSHARVGNFMHIITANLHLYWGAKRSKQSGVQRLITIGFGDGNKIFKFAWNRLVERM